MMFFAAVGLLLPPLWHDFVVSMLHTPEMSYAQSFAIAVIFWGLIEAIKEK